MGRSDWSNGIRSHVFDTRPTTEFKHLRGIMELGSGTNMAQVPTEKRGMILSANGVTSTKVSVNRILYVEPGRMFVLAEV
jgi:hypothetical protein